MFRKNLVHILVGLFLISLNVYSFSRNKILTSNELFSSSDLVAFVRLSEGAMLVGVGNKVNLIVEKVLKGNFEQKDFKTSYGYLSSPEHPNTLGSIYLIFLKNNDGEDIVINQFGYSVIEISKITKNRGDIDLVYKKLGITSSEVRIYDDDTVFYPVVCESYKRLCKLALDSIDAALE